jgi:AraC family transcriptional regulator, regulatory protein of adaptative response / methylphosphotriester-DNA alkyltransferase methyltransferase
MPLRPSTATHRQTLLREPLELMELEYADQLALDDVARRIATSRRQLQRCFAEHSDESFRECLTRIRMDRAAELLAASHRQVALAVGYHQPAQFAKAFRRRYGVAPSEYRALASTGREPPERPAHASAGARRAATAAGK